MKQILRNTVLLLTIVSVLFSCSKETATTVTPTPPPTPTPTAPVADFSYTGAGRAPSIVSFTNSSTNATSYTWDFGDNGTSVGTNPTHTYTTGGVYTVRLTATGSGGTNSTSKTVNITSPTKVTVTKITLTGMPFTTSNGSGWDPLDGPDVYFKITNVNNVALYTQSTYYPNQTLGSLPIAHTLSPAYQTTDLTSYLYVHVWDYDTIDEDDLVDWVGFILPTSGSNAYPATLTNTRNGVTVTLNLTWQ